MSLQTPRLSLINCTPELLRILLRGDEALSQHLGVETPPHWSEFGKAAFRYTLEKLDGGDDPRWWSYLPILKEEGILVGSCGYKGAPTMEGMVEIGYEVSRAFRHQGLATEMAAALIQKAFTYPKVTFVQAHTQAEKNASAGVLEKCGMKMVEELEMPGEGKVWRWKVYRRSTVNG